jgi:hypothetical protein
MLNGIRERHLQGKHALPEGVQMPVHRLPVRAASVLRSSPDLGKQVPHVAEVEIGLLRTYAEDVSPCLRDRHSPFARELAEERVETTRRVLKICHAKTLLRMLFRLPQRWHARYRATSRLTLPKAVPR